MPNYDIVLFDFDGTLVDTSEGIFKSLIYALESDGVPEPPESVLRKFIGPPIYDSFKNLFGYDEDKIQYMINKYRERYKVKGIYELEIYDGIVDLLKKLKENNIKVATASSKPRVFIERILEKFELAEYIDYIGGTDFDEKNNGKAAILLNSLEQLGCKDKSKAIMVGDRKFDIDGAKGAGIECIAVRYGFGNDEEFIRHGAEYIVDDAKGIEKIIFGEN